MFVRECHVPREWHAILKQMIIIIIFFIIDFYVFVTT